MQPLPEGLLCSNLPGPQKEGLLTGAVCSGREDKLLLGKLPPLQISACAGQWGEKLTLPFISSYLVVSRHHRASLTPLQLFILLCRFLTKKLGGGEGGRRYYWNWDEYLLAGPSQLNVSL